MDNQNSKKRAFGEFDKEVKSLNNLLNEPGAGQSENDVGINKNPAKKRKENP